MERTDGSWEAPYISSPPTTPRVSHKSVLRQVWNRMKIPTESKQHCEHNKRWEGPGARLFKAHL